MIINKHLTLHNRQINCSDRTLRSTTDNVCSATDRPANRYAPTSVLYLTIADLFKLREKTWLIGTL